MQTFLRRVTGWPRRATDKSGKKSVGGSDRQAAYQQQTGSYRLKDTERHRRAGLTCCLCGSPSKARRDRQISLNISRSETRRTFPPQHSAPCLPPPLPPCGLQQSARPRTAGVSTPEPDYKYIARRSCQFA